MTVVTRDVVKDLLSIYLAGEGSPDTRRLVEEHLASDDVLAREVETARRDLALPPTPTPARSGEKKALDTTRQLLKHRTSTLVVAILFTLLPLTFVPEGSRVVFVVLRDAPVIAVTWWSTAAVMWLWHMYIRRRLRVSGL